MQLGSLTWWIYTSLARRQTGSGCSTARNRILLSGLLQNLCDDQKIFKCAPISSRGLFFSSTKMKKHSLGAGEYIVL